MDSSALSSVCRARARSFSARSRMVWTMKSAMPMAISSAPKALETSQARRRSRCQSASATSTYSAVVTSSAGYSVGRTNAKTSPPSKREGSTTTPRSPPAQARGPCLSSRPSRASSGGSDAISLPVVVSSVTRRPARSPPNARSVCTRGSGTSATPSTWPRPGMFRLRAKYSDHSPVTGFLTGPPKETVPPRWATSAKSFCSEGGRRRRRESGSAAAIGVPSCRISITSR